ncbi:nucleoside triphosphate pyrophosphohydrolase [Roseisolibacter sp. H3M3-2]|nr:nucleoside triphosphate pyrophosphohydrolase [Roseisolibacter sp. H3M3-2]MDF1503020.1 nucleoside triphosphate pyrophosphohydrolase [Roseisolibacter sp. H3M3-2]
MQDEHGGQPPTTLEDTLALMRDLRARCDWDRAQTHESLRPYLIEEAYEVDEAIQHAVRDGTPAADATLRDELGDLLLQVLFHSVVAEERGAFALHDVAHALVTKMRARHPHLYPPAGGAPVESKGWEALKAKKRKSIDEGLPEALPSLHKAHRLQDRAAGVGFDWPDAQGPADKIAEELAEVREELAKAPPAQLAHGLLVSDHRHAALEAELGDLLFSVVNLCRKVGVHASIALDKANAKFADRFGAVEKLAAQRGIDVNTAGLEQLDELWDEIKRERRES